MLARVLCFGVTRLAFPFVIVLCLHLVQRRISNLTTAVVPQCVLGALHRDSNSHNSNASVPAICNVISSLTLVQSELGEEAAEQFFKFVAKMNELDLQNGESGNAVDEMSAHRFLEHFNETMTVREVCARGI